jgi:uncharacterized protein YlxW (UPF0749 family)
MSNDTRLSLRKTLFMAVLAAAAAFHAAAEQFKAAAESDETDKQKLQTQLDDANAQLDDAHKQLATAQDELAKFQAEEKLEDHPELTDQLTALGVTDGEVTTPAAELPAGAAGTGEAAASA